MVSLFALNLILVDENFLPIYANVNIFLVFEKMTNVLYSYFQVANLFGFAEKNPSTNLLKNESNSAVSYGLHGDYLIEQFEAKLVGWSMRSIQKLITSPHPLRACVPSSSTKNQLENTFHISR